MIRVSIEVPENFQYRLKPIVDLRRRFLDDGILVGFELKNADLRILHHDFAIGELEQSSDGRLKTPVIVDERIDGAQIIDSVAVRSAMAHPDVKLWLKRNTFRDYRLNNENLVAGRYHYQLLNDVPEFHVSVAQAKVAMPVTAEMAAKIRLLPTVNIDRFKFFREQKIDWNQKRPIDVSFAGLVDYEIRGTDFWDEKFAEAKAATRAGLEFLPDRHRRAAVQHMARLRHLRVLIGMNRSLQADLYEQAMMRSSISISPWGFGEYGYRDYESILAGCVMVKPLTDHVETFAPDIYQSGKYYFACKADFSDLAVVIEEIMSDRSRAIELARRAHDDMLKANSPERVYSYYLDLFKQALGKEVVAQAASWASSAGPLLSLERGQILAVRSEIHPGALVPRAIGTKSSIVLKEDSSTKNTHDIRIFADVPVPAGLYRLRAAVRKRGRSGVALQLHLNWKEQIWFDFDLDLLVAEHRHTNGELFKPLYGPELSNIGDGWIVITLAVELTDLAESGLGLVLYASDKGNYPGYDGDGRVALELAALDLTRIDMRVLPVDTVAQ